MLRDQRLQLADHLGVAPRREIRLDRKLVRVHAQLRQPPDRRGGEGLVGALAAPSAIAGPIDPVPTGSYSRDDTSAVAVEPEPAPAAAPVVRTIDEGFDWGSAAIGAGGAGALLVLISLGGFAYTSRGRLQVARRTP
jgi:hypothetical protein